MYITNIYSLGATVVAVLTAILIRLTNRVKWLALYIGLPLQFLGLALIIAFRHPGSSLALLILAQIIVAFSTGILILTEQIALMAAARSHADIAVLLAIESMFTSIGQALGHTISSAIWTKKFPAALRNRLPTEKLKSEWPKIYASLKVQLMFPVGTAVREAISLAYADAQRDLLIVATCVIGLAVVAVVIWRDYKLSDIKQVRGNVV
ncbi:MAG: hypothetical protein Q9227_005910 [Pyrenula ochraceoflavens]